MKDLITVNGRLTKYACLYCGHKFVSIEPDRRETNQDVTCPSCLTADTEKVSGGRCGYEETAAKIGNAIDNCSYIDDMTVDVILELYIREARKRGCAMMYVIKLAEEFARRIYNEEIEKKDEKQEAVVESPTKSSDPMEKILDAVQESNGLLAKILDAIQESNGLLAGVLDGVKRY